MNLSSITKSECKDLVNEIINYQEALNSWSYDGINGNRANKTDFDFSQ